MPLVFKTFGSVLAVVAAFSWFAGGDSKKHEIVGKVVSVSDGDTITVVDDDKTQHKIRLEGIDAPESHQAFGARAKQSLSAKVFGNIVRVEWSERDKYQRILGHVYIDDRWINRELVADGFAWHYKKYSTSTDLADAESKAQAAKVGLWNDAKPVAPWDFRHSAEAAATALENPAPPTNGISVYITNGGTKYHAANCRFLAKSATPIELKEAAARFAPCTVCKPPTVGVVPDVSAPLASEATALSPAAPPTDDPTVFVTKTGTKYHNSGCRSLSKSRIPVSLSDAKKRFGPCSVCNPPK